MKKPLYFRKEIPFYHDKTDSEFRHDRYENYIDMVLRQVALHLGDNLWEEYPFQSILDFIKTNLKFKDHQTIVEIGCGVGRVISDLALENNTSRFYGIDYSYQMLKMAHNHWVGNKPFSLDCTHKGFPQIDLSPRAIENLAFGLAKAEALPFVDDSIDVIFSNFLFDRLDSPKQATLEMHRVLKKGGQMLIVTPLNFQHKDHWQQYYPISKLKAFIEENQFEIIHTIEQLLIKEPLDYHGNFIQWNCLAMYCLRK